MPDPFDQRRIAIVGSDPDPTFAARLRDRLARALNLPKGVTVSDLTLDAALPDPSAAPTAAAVITPYLAVSGAQAALDWYQEAFGARLRGQPIVMADGTIGHAELDLGGAPLMLSEEHPELGVVAPTPNGAVPVTMHLEVVDVDATIGRTVAAGGRLERPAADYDYGRNGVIRDPFGHRWLISGPPPGPRIGHGDIGYVSLWLPNIERAAAFYSRVLGWRYAPASGPQGRRVEGLAVHHGLWGGVDPPTLFCCYAVDDITAATTRVTAAGGTAGAATFEPYGLVAECTDDQVVRFAVYQPPGGVSSQGSVLQHGGRQGDLAYVTMEVVDSVRARAFYGSVLGWRFSGGRVDDGWQADDVAPMVGFSGGHQAATTIPMYRVDDISAAVEVVRDAGGTSTDPEPQLYGITAACTDDQGTRFYLGQLS